MAGESGGAVDRAPGRTAAVRAREWIPTRPRLAGLLIGVTLVATVFDLVWLLGPYASALPGLLAVCLLAFVAVAARSRRKARAAAQLSREHAALRAESRAQLAASRARLVAAADETRRRIERDLHDGVQQRLISANLALRLAQDSVPDELPQLRSAIGNAADQLSAAVDELRETARGIHPAILTEGGLRPALRALARRSPIPVELHATADARLPQPIEVAAYYVVSEALTNATKHAHASFVLVSLVRMDGMLRLTVRDDGVGGACPHRGGSGLLGLRDRVEALDGVIEITSTPGAGTTLRVTLPIHRCR